MAPQRSWRALSKADCSCDHPLPPALLPTSPLQQPPIAYVIESKHFNIVSKAMAIWPLPGPRMSSSLGGRHTGLSSWTCALPGRRLPSLPGGRLLVLMLSSQDTPSSTAPLKEPGPASNCHITCGNLHSPCHRLKVISSSTGTKLQESQGPYLSSPRPYPSSRAMPRAQ